MSKFYQLDQTDKKADLYIFGEISSYPWKEKDRDAYGVVKELQDLDVEEINVHINSSGGSVSEGLAIYNVLKNHSAKVTTICDGFACSAASVVFMAGDERVMNESSLLMIHNAWTYGYGNANELRKQAEDLDKITQASVNAYVRNAVISEEEIKKMMDEETWISAEDAKTFGFATSILEEDHNGVNQSAMQVIKKSLLENSKNKSSVDNEVIEKIAVSVCEKLKENEIKSVPSEEGWDAFLNGGK